MIAVEEASRHSLLIDEDQIYIDEAVSARKTEIQERPSLVRLLSQIEKGSIKTLVVYKRDRLARNIKQHMEIYELLKDRKVNVIFTAANELPLQYSPVGEFFELVIAGFNEREAKQIATRIMETKKSQFLLRKNQSRLPYGYFSDKKDKSIHRDEKKLSQIKKIYDELLNTNCKTFSDFIRWLEKNSVIPKKKSNYNNIRNYIRTKEYKGLRVATFDQEEIEIEYSSLAVVSEDTWEQAQNKLDSLIRIRIKHSKNHEALLEGLVFCNLCDSIAKVKYIPIRGIRYLVYKCDVHYRVKVNQKLLDDLILSYVVQRIEDLATSKESALFEEATKIIIIRLTQQLNEIQTNLQVYQNKALHLADKWLVQKGMDLQEKILQVNKQITELKHKQRYHNDVIVALSEYPSKIRQMWNQIQLDEKLEQLSFIERQELVQDVVEKVILGTNGELRFHLKNPFVERAPEENGGVGFVVKIDT